MSLLHQVMNFCTVDSVCDLPRKICLQNCKKPALRQWIQSK